MIQSIEEAAVYFGDVFCAHPERDAVAAYRAASDGKRRQHAVFYLNHLATPDDRDTPQDDFALPEVRMAAGPEADLARAIVNLADPLKMLNPVSPALRIGPPGTSAWIPSFGIPLNPEAGYAPAHSMTLEEALAQPEPDPVTSGIMPDLKRQIDFIKSHVPPGHGITINLPDIQGPFNIAHAVLGNDALIGPYVDPEAFSAFMDRAARFWIAACRMAMDWIGPEWLDPTILPLQISECSVNLISPEMYVEHVLPHDLKLSAAFDELAIHPCSGPHVFHVTLKHIPNVVRTEAGFIAKTAAGAISVDEALATIGDRPIGVKIGQELPEGGEFECIRNDLDRCERNPRLHFGYTGMHWRIKDRPKIRELHRRSDAYWVAKYGQ